MNCNQVFQGSSFIKGQSSKAGTRKKVCQSDNKSEEGNKGQKQIEVEGV